MTDAQRLMCKIMGWTCRYDYLADSRHPGYCGEYIDPEAEECEVGHPYYL